MQDNIPSVNVIENLVCFFFAISQNNIILDPCHQMVLEDPFDELVQDIGGDQFMDVGSWKIFCKGLLKVRLNTQHQEIRDKR
jgi:hypothetical protein